MFVGESGSGQLNQTGGVFWTHNGIELAQNAGSSGVYVLGAGSSTGGGTVLTPYVSGGSGSSTFEFNGGYLQAYVLSGTTNPSENLLSNINTVEIRNGGANINPEGSTAYLTMPLQHSSVSGDNAVDGGLAMTGAGTLVLTGVNTYTGRTLTPVESCTWATALRKRTATTASTSSNRAR